MQSHRIGSAYARTARDIPMTERKPRARARALLKDASETETRVRSEREGPIGRSARAHINYRNKRAIRVRGANAN